jgi:hypothetical protein
MYYSSRIAAAGWPGEPHRDPLMEDASNEEVTGQETTPKDILEYAYNVFVNYFLHLPLLHLTKWLYSVCLMMMV